MNEILPRTRKQSQDRQDSIGKKVKIIAEDEQRGLNTTEYF
jgi:hypothetical protein